jgi:hypothetical protein
MHTCGELGRSYEEIYDGMVMAAGMAVRKFSRRTSPQPTAPRRPLA